MISVAVIGIVAVLIAIQLKSVKPEFSVYLTLAAGFLIFSYIFIRLETIVDALNQIQSYININPAYVSVLLKMIGITYVAEFSSNLCKDAGYQSIGSQIELFGKLMIMAVSMPVVLALLETIHQFLEA